MGFSFSSDSVRVVPRESVMLSTDDGVDIVLNTLEEDYLGIMCTNTVVRVVHEAIEMPVGIRGAYHSMFKGPPIQLSCPENLLLCIRPRSSWFPFSSFLPTPPDLPHLLRNSRRLRAVVQLLIFIISTPGDPMARRYSRLNDLSLSPDLPTSVLNFLDVSPPHPVSL